MPRHNQFLVSTIVGPLVVGERITGENGYGSGVIEELSANSLSERTGRRLLKELIKLYPLDALGEV